MITSAKAVLTLDTYNTPTHLLKLRVTFERRSRYFPVKSGYKCPHAEFEAKRTKGIKTAIEDATPCLAAAQKLCAEMGANFDWSVFGRRYDDWYNGRDVVGSTTTFLALHNEYISSKELEPKTVSIYSSAANWVERFSPDVRICDIAPGFIAKFISFLKREHRKDKGDEMSENTVRIYLRYINTLFNYAIKKGYMVCKNPVATDRTNALSSIPRQKAALSEEDWKKFLHGEPSDAHESFAKDFFIASMQMSGANIGDILRLRNRDIVGDIVVFTRHKTRKTAIIIEVPLTPALKQFFLNYGALDPDNPGALVLPFLAGTKDANNEKNRIHAIVARINSGLKSFCTSAGIRKVTTYTARHTFATFGMARGLSIGELQKFLGHASSNTTEVYLSSLTQRTIEKNREILKDMMND